MLLQLKAKIGKTVTACNKTYTKAKIGKTDAESTNGGENIIKTDAKMFKIVNDSRTVVKNSRLVAKSSITRERERQFAEADLKQCF